MKKYTTEYCNEIVEANPVPLNDLLRDAIRASKKMCESFKGQPDEVQKVREHIKLAHQQNSLNISNFINNKLKYEKQSKYLNNISKVVNQNSIACLIVSTVSTIVNVKGNPKILGLHVVPFAISTSNDMYED